MKLLDAQFKNKEIREKMIESLGLDHLKKGEQDKIVGMLIVAISSRLQVEIWQRLSVSDKKEFEAVSTNNEEQGFLDYVTMKISNFPQLVEQITREVVDDFRVRRMELSQDS